MDDDGKNRRRVEFLITFRLPAAAGGTEDEECIIDAKSIFEVY
jgi:hypothetical protein